MEWLADVAQTLNQYKIQLLGAIGAALALQFNPDARRSRGSAAIFIITGGMIAYVCTDFFLRIFDLSKVDDAGMVGFLLGTFGGAIVAAIYKAILAADLWNLAANAWNSRFGK